jgi:hypothetical protein
MIDRRQRRETDHPVRGNVEDVEETAEEDSREGCEGERGGLLDRSRDGMGMSGAEGAAYEAEPKLRLSRGRGEGGCMRDDGLEISRNDMTIV